jgi:urocanate hydratase
VTQYGQMTAGSYMYIGPQGIVHGTTITVLNACRMIKGSPGTKGKLFVTAGLGGMSGAQPKAGNIAGVVTICAEVNATAAHKRHSQGWVDEVIADVDACIDAALAWQQKGEAHSIAFLGNVVDLWERLAARKIKVDLGSDQTSLHNPWAGGYYPAGLSYEESNALMVQDPAAFKQRVQDSLKRQVTAINTLTGAGHVFLRLRQRLPAGEQARRCGDRWAKGEEFRYPSYVEDIMGPLCFDHGFGPFRWVVRSGDPKDLATSDRIAGDVLEAMLNEAPEAIRQQIADNLHWIRSAQQNKLVVGSQARILYADSEGRIRIAEAFNAAIKGRGDQRTDRAGPRPPRRERHRQSVPRDQQHPRRQRASPRTWPCRTSWAMPSAAPRGSVCTTAVAWAGAR